MIKFKEVRYLSVSIEREPEAVYAFTSNPENLPQWALGLEAIRKLIDGKETFEQDIDRSKIDPTFGALRAAVVLLAQLSIATQPRERSLNHPALWQYGKANLIGRLGHDFNTTREVLIDPLDKHLLVTLVDTQDFQRCERVSMLVQEPDGAFALTDIGSVNQHTQHKAVRVNN
jgi:hypothetical protein